MLFKAAEGGTSTTNLAMTWTVGEYTWGIEPKSNYAWSDGTYGRKTFNVKILKAPLTVIFTDGADTYSNPTDYSPVTTSSCSVNITDSDILSGATYNIGKRVTFKIVDHTGFEIAATIYPGSNISLSGSTNDTFNAICSSRAVTIYGLGNGGNTVNINLLETEKYCFVGDSSIDVTVDRSLASLQSWAKIREICQAGKVNNYAKGDETYPVTLNGTVGTVSVSGNYLAQLVDYDHTNTTWAICKKEGVSGHIAFADSYYGTLVTNGAKAFAHITDTAESTTGENSALRSRANEFYNALSAPAKSYLTINAWDWMSVCSSTDKIVFFVSWGYFNNGNKAPFKHFTSGVEVKVWESMYIEGAEARATTFNGSSATYDRPDLHMSLGLVPIFTVG